ncbi:related to RING finger protein Dorfin [Phialocephala subalpina]|uniref:RBR-type E3 ubiquitin transferase n=1 Tax=Phialocephala subalpina TaxID=576137 RepID=A0A1L7XVN5_9HELO|nr:related to RING finger protein Dorfin [Phialocephala subalpina]
MASNDGQRLTVLGLSFRQHHTLHMQQVLRAYERLPENPMDRAALYTGLFQLAKNLDEDETKNIEHWLLHGGEFPAPTPKVSEATEKVLDRTSEVDSDEEEDWPEYRPEDFEDDGEAVRDPMEEDDDEDEDHDGVPHTSHITGEAESENSGSGSMEGHDGDLSEEGSEQDSEDEPEARPRRPSGRPRRRPAVAKSSKGKSAAESLECLICAESYLLTEFPPSTEVTSTCNHKNNERTCIYCLQQSIESAVTDGQLNLIVCPFCPEKLSREEIKKYATPEIFARYDYLALIATPDLVMCLGLNCGSGQIHTSEDPMMTCQACSFKTCAFHKLPWHEGQTCEEFDTNDDQIERLEQAEATAMLLAKEHAQVCPNCGNGVSRTEGCDHMTCRCGHEWCYLCGTSYENMKRLGDEAHAPTCMYHPRRVQMRRDQERKVQGHLTELIHGGPVSETLERARGARNERVRAELRPKAAEAAERRMREMDQQNKENKVPEKKRRLNLKPAWEEK